MHSNELIVVHGTNPVAMAKEALGAAKIENLIPPGALIALKPNLVVSKDASSGAVTHPEIAEGIIEYLRGKGFSRFVIMEGSWVGDRTSRAYVAAGYRDLSERLGVPFVDLQLDTWKRYDAGGGHNIAVCDQAMAAGFMINLPVIKGHCQTNVTCALKNMKGCMPDDEKSRFHSLGLHEPIARLGRVLKPGFILADGLCGDLDFEEGGNPVQMNRLVAAVDPVLMDAFACRLMGHDIEDVPYVGLAEEYGVGSTDLTAANIVEIGDSKAAPVMPPRSGRVRALATRVTEKAASSACYAALIHGLARLEERGSLKRLDAALGTTHEKRIAIGRDFKGQGYDGLGCGLCASGATRSVKGCPPDGAAVAEFLEALALGR